MFKIVKTETPGNRVTLDERAWLTRDGRLVKDGDPDAAVLYCAPGHSVSRADYEARMPKAKAAPKNKAKRAPANKGKGE